MLMQLCGAGDAPAAGDAAMGLADMTSVTRFSLCVADLVAPGALWGYVWDGAGVALAAASWGL